MKKSLETVQLQPLVPIHMPIDVLYKVKYLCKSISREEWSGVLFYECEGSIQDPANFKINLKDILPLDRGTSTFTSYTYDNRFIDYLMEDPVRLEWRVGHIHSHNTMSVFFSGTDMEELNDNAPNHNFYLSLIVNNYMDMTAKIAFVGKAEESVKLVPFNTTDEAGRKYTIETSNFSIIKEKLFIYDCKIDNVAETIIVPEDFKSKVSVLLLPKPKPEVKSEPLFKKANSYPKSKSKSIDPQFDMFDMEFSPYLGELDDSSYFISENALEDFTIDVINFFDLPVAHNAFVEDFLTYLEENSVDGNTLAKHIIKVSPMKFNEWYPSRDADYLQIMGEMLDRLEEYAFIYPLLRTTLRVLDNHLAKYNNGSKKFSK